MNGEEGFSGCGPGAHKGPGDDLFNLEDATQPCQELAETGSATFGRRQGSLLPPRAAPPRPEDSHEPATQPESTAKFQAFSDLPTGFNRREA